MSHHFPLHQEQLDEFIENGVLVVDNVFTEDEIKVALEGMKLTLLEYGVDVDDLSNTGHYLKQLSSTNGSGGVLDIFYPEWKLKMAMNQKLFSIISQLWSISFHHKPNDFEYSPEEEWNTKKHPFGPFDCSKGYIYMDRIGYRIPTKLAKEIGKQEKSRPIQRSLTPHLDCCPDTLFSNNTKWRPLQSMISLTSNEESNTGGFEAVKGFHSTFYDWTQQRAPTLIQKKDQSLTIPPPCVGQFTPIRPREDRDVITRMEHIPCKPGSVVIWDYRIPHANARRNDSDVSRAVIYASFLPDVNINRKYVEQQLNDFRNKKNPTDQWIESNENQINSFMDDDAFSNFEKKLLGMEKWDSSI